MAAITTAISDEPLDVASLLSSASAPSCGAIASFIGTVRESASVGGNEATPVTRLEYDAHPELAPAAIADIAQQAADKWTLERVVAVHRSGICDLGDPTVVIACGAAHRGDALEACRWIIDTVKASVPIWKKEIYADGSSWVDPHGA